ncbi:hypothetical protein BH11PSE11_BH11PSE11_13790 [soil metagenome]
MDSSTVFTKTAKGVKESVGKTTVLSVEYRKILKEIDGATALGELAAKLGNLSQSKLQSALEKMLDGDYIREFATQPGMDSSTIFTKTAKGLKEAVGKTTVLSSDYRKILKEIDGTTSFGQLPGKLGNLPESKLRAALEKMLDGDYIREFVIESNTVFAPDIKFKEAGPETRMMASGAGFDLDFSSIATQQIMPEEAPAKLVEKPGTKEKPKSDANLAGEAAAHAKKQAETAAKLEVEERAKADAKRVAMLKARAEAEQLARARAEEEARVEAAAQARKEAEAKEKRDAEEKAKRQAVEVLKQQLARQTQEKAEREAAALARKEAEEKAKKLAAEHLRQQVERQALEKAKREAAAQAEAQALQEAQEKARREAGAQAKKEAEEQARRAAEEQARKEAEAKAKKEAEEKARREAEALAKKEAEEQARLAAEEQARKEAAEKTRLEAEARAKKEAEEQARLAEELARKEAEAKAKKEAEEKARLEAEARAKKEAEEQARLAAEELARKEAEAREAEEKASLEAEARAKKEAEEQARLAAEEQARKEAQARKDAEEKARLEAEARAKKESEEKARQEAEARARKEAEVLARREAEELAQARAREQQAQEQKLRQAAEARAATAVMLDANANDDEDENTRRDLEEKARKDEELLLQEVEELARKDARDAATLEADALKKEADEKVRRKAEALAEKKLARQARAARKELAEAAGEANAHVPDAGFRPPIKWGKPVAFTLLLLIVGGLALLHLMPFDSKRLVFEKAASEQFQQPVKIGAVHLALAPRPHWRLEQISIGKESQIKIAEIKAEIDSDAAKDTPAFKSIELISPSLNEEGLGWLLLSAPSAQNLKFTQLEAKGARLDLKNFTLPLFNVKTEIGPAASLKKIDLESEDKNLQVSLMPDGDVVRIQMTADTFAVPFGSSTTLQRFKATGTANRNALLVNDFSGNLFDGTVNGTATLAWGATWTLKGEIAAKQIRVFRFMPELVDNGGLDGKARFSMQAQDAATLFTAAPRAEGNFIIRDGTVAGVNLGLLFRNPQSRGSSKFAELSGAFFHESGKTQVRKINLIAGMLSTTGTLDVDAESKLNGNFVVDLRFPERQHRSNLAVTGTLKSPRFNE